LVAGLLLLIGGKLVAVVLVFVFDALAWLEGWGTIYYELIQDQINLFARVLFVLVRNYFRGLIVYGECLLVNFRWYLVKVLVALDILNLLQKLQAFGTT
jgi:hypothetical protein